MQLALGPIDASGPFPLTRGPSQVFRRILGRRHLTDEWLRRSVGAPTDQWHFVEPNLTRSVKWAQAALMDRRTSDRIAFVRFDITTGEDS
jgi:hypothetical protein